MIGDCETAALVSHSGAIDWLCWPDFSSPACFAALLGSPDNGHWTLAPRDKLVSSKRQYQPHTLILETTMETRRGKVIVTDFMPIRGRNSDVVRTVRCVSGAVVMHMTLCLRFEYGKAVPWIDPESGSVGPQDGGVCLIARVGPNLAVLRTDAAAHESTPGTIFAEFTLKAGDTRKFALTYGSAYEDVPAPINIDQALLETRQFWTQWASRCQYKGPYSEAVERSFITLKAMIWAAHSTGITATAGSGMRPSRSPLCSIPATPKRLLHGRNGSLQRSDPMPRKYRSCMASKENVAWPRGTFHGCRAMKNQRPSALEMRPRRRFSRISTARSRWPSFTRARPAFLWTLTNFSFSRR
jgi:GH15 family glucan-1,4-alpha-glucosidase